MTSLRKHLAFLAVLFAFGLLAASCGGSAAEPVDAAPAATEAVPETTVTEPPATEAPVETTAPESDHDDDGHMDDDDMDEGHEDEGHDDEGHEDEGHDDEGHEDEDVEVPEDARVVFVFMNEYGFEPSVFTAAPGETVVYRILNTGELPHEFRLSNAHRVEEHIASGHEGHGEGGGHHEGDADIIVEVEEGRSAELVVTFPMDESVFTTVVCLLPDHYEKGMHAELTYS